MTQPSQSQGFATAAYQTLRVGQVVNGFTVQAVFGNPAGSGLTGYALRQGSGEVVIAFRGTQDGQDWADNLTNFGYRQWQEAKPAVERYLAGLPRGTDVTFTGHSLGGGLAQYAAYDAVHGNLVSRGDLTMHTFATLGGKLGIDRYAGGYNPNVLNFANDIRHFFNPEDVVPRIAQTVGGTTLSVGDVVGGRPDGVLAAHNLAQFTPAKLAAATPATPRVMDAEDLLRDPGASAEALGRIMEFANKPLGTITPADVVEVINDIRSLPLRDAASLGEFLLYAIGQVEWQLINAGIDQLGAVARGISDFFDELVGRVERQVSGRILGLQQAFQESLRPLRDPLILDLGPEGIDLVSMAQSGVWFDMNGDGIAERTGWLTPEDGFLALDRNGNGRIDGIAELIGKPDRSGFEELATFDANRDGVIDARDPAFAQFRVWRDLDSDGRTDPGELTTLAANRVRSLDLSYTEVTFTAAENRIHEQGNYTTTTGERRLLIDVWMQTEAPNGAAGTVTPSAAVAALPNLRGYGSMPDLHTAMMRDTGLLTLVQSLTALTPAQADLVRPRVEAMLYRWAGAHTLDPDSRGGVVDARKLAVIEAAASTPWRTGGRPDGSPNPVGFNAAPLEAAFALLLDGYVNRMLALGVFDGANGLRLAYASNLDVLVPFEGPEAIVARLAALAPAGPDARSAAAYWGAVAPLAFELSGTGGEAATAAALAAALGNSVLSGFTDALRDGPLRDLRSAPVQRTTIAERAIVLLGNGDNEVQLGRDGALLGGAGSDWLRGAAGWRAALDGGAGTDVLQGGRDADTLNGGTGADWMEGGGGNDLYTVDHANDVVVEFGNGGTDTVRSSVSVTLPAHVENGILLGGAPLSLTGNALANKLTGNAGANVLRGLGGDDTYEIGPGDRVIEAEDEGYDTIIGALGFVLPAHVEEGRLGGNGAFALTGNALPNRLVGNDGPNRIDGGAGGDDMVGGPGNDVYILDDSRDRVTERDGGGIDTIVTPFDAFLPFAVENITLSGTANVNASGNGDANRLQGNAGRNRLDGRDGADTMLGGAGDDTYIVDDAGDVVAEAADAGRDRVETDLARYALTAFVEDLVYTGFSAFTGIGNAGDNILTGRNGNDSLSGGDGDDSLTGSSGNDTLDGGNGDDTLDGGTGTDRMSGGFGDDTYLVESTGDVVIEAPGAGRDTVIINRSYILPNEIENATQTGFGNADLSGNAAANRLVGNSNANVLDGRGGADTLAGGAGDDTYIVDRRDDRIEENASEGTDTVKASVDWQLAPDLEHLELIGTTARHATGNAGANRLVGNAAANIISGDGGADTLTGGAGADSFVLAPLVEGQPVPYTRITDFAVGAGGDRLIVGDLLASVGYRGRAPVADRVMSVDPSFGGSVLWLDRGWNGTTRDWVQVGFLDGVDPAALRVSPQIVATPLPNTAPVARFALDLLAMPANEQTVWRPPADLFFDFDGDALTLSVQQVLPNGTAAPLPDWLSFNPRIGALVGTPLGSDRDVTLRLTARDPDGATAQATLEIDVRTGQTGDQTFAPRDAADTITPGPGDDIVRAGGGNDVIRVTTARAPGDTDDGRDVYDGGAGFDTLVFVDFSTPVAVNLAAELILGAGLGRDTVRNIERVIGGSGNDRLTGSAQAEWLDGGAGADTLDGGGGPDTLSGGAGPDVFVISTLAPRTAPVTILGFDGPGTAAGDRIDLSGLDADLTRAGRQGFSFGTAAGPGRLQAVAQGTDTLLLGYVNADAVPDLAILLRDGTVPPGAYSQADFLV